MNAIERKIMAGKINWWRRIFTLAGRDAAWRDAYLRKHGRPFPGHVPPRPMPAPAPRPEITLEERAERYRRGMAIREFLSDDMRLQLAIDADILSGARERRMR